MLKKLLFLLFISCIPNGIMNAQFEGSIDMKVVIMNEGKAEEMFYTMMVKKNMMAADIKSAVDKEKFSRFIFRGDKQQLWIIDDDNKSYIEVSLKEDEKKGINQAVNDKTKINKTGKKETILGYPCEEVIIEDKDETTQIWGTSKLGNLYADLIKSFGKISGTDDASYRGSWEKEIELLKLFPLKIIFKENNKITQTQEVTKIESKSIPSSTFEVPKGYIKQKLEFDMDKMMKGVQDRQKVQKEKGGEIDKDNPGMNIDLEKMMKQLQEMQEEKGDTTDNQ